MTSTAQDLVDSGFRRAKIATALVTAEMSVFAAKALYHLLLHCANKIPLLWKLDTKPYGLYVNKAGLYLEDNTVDVVAVNHRTISAYGGTATSSAGGSPTAAFDGEEDTAFTQTASDGNLSVDIGSTSTMRVEVVGVMAYGNNDYNLVFETSSDGSTWRTLYTVSPPTNEVATLYEDRIWHWYDMPQTWDARYFRVRETSGGTLSFRHVVLGKSPSEIPMAPVNRDIHFSTPNRNALGRPLQYWTDRQQSAPVLWIWPLPDITQKYNQIVVTRHAHIIEPTLSEAINVPPRWLGYIKAELASQLALEYAEMVQDPNWPMTLMTIAQKMNVEVFGEERDKSDMFITPRLRKS